MDIPIHLVFLVMSHNPTFMVLWFWIIMEAQYERGKNMKRFVMGVMVGVVLTFPFAGAASTELIGKMIQGTFPLFIDGERAAKDVIVVDGTSYLPVRVSGEMFGYDVSFDEVDKEVHLNKQIEETTIDTQSTGGEEVTVKQDQKITEAYYYRSNVIDIWLKDDQEEKLPYLVWDGNVYVPWQIFNNYRTKQNEQVYPNGNKLTINTEESLTYEKDKDYFAFAGKSMIKLSLTGYKIEINGDEAWITE